MPRKRKRRTPRWALPEWQREILLTALDDHALVLKRLIGHQPSSAYFGLIQTVRENLIAHPK